MIFTVLAFILATGFQERPYLIDDPELTASEITWVNGYLFLNDEFREHKIRMYNAADGTFIGSWGTSGRGPGDYISALLHPGSNSNLLEVVDTNNKKIDVYNTNCLGDLNVFTEAPGCIIETIPIVSSREAIHLGGNHVLDHSSTYEGNLFLANENRRELLSELPDEIYDLHRRPVFSVMMATGRLVASPDRMSAAYFADSFDYAQFFNLDENEEKLKLTHTNPFTWLPDFNVMELDIGGMVSEGDNYRHAFYSPVFNAATDTYFVLYSGRYKKDYENDSGGMNRAALSQAIKVFTRNGEEVDRVELEEEVQVFTISADGRMLYGLTIDDDSVTRVIEHELN